MYHLGGIVGKHDMHRRIPLRELAGGFPPPLIDITARILAGIQIIADRLFHLGDQDIYISPCIEDILLQFPKTRQKIARRQECSSISGNGSIPRPGIGILFSRKKSGHFIVFFKRLRNLQTPFVFFEKFPLDQLILK